MVKKVKIDSLACIRFGLYVQPKSYGRVSYLQARQFSNEGNLISSADEYIDLDKRAELHLLKEGDVLFTGKGSRLFSWCYHQIEQPAVASSMFFILRPDLNIIHPPYLAAILNTPSNRAAFQQIGGGTNIFSIRKSELGAFEIPLPPMQQQKRIAALAALHQQEIELSQKLITEKQNLYTAIISKLIK